MSVVEIIYNRVKEWCLSKGLNILETVSYSNGILSLVIEYVSSKLLLGLNKYITTSFSGQILIGKIYDLQVMSKIDYTYADPYLNDNKSYINLKLYLRNVRVNISPQFEAS